MSLPPSSKGSPPAEAGKIYYEFTRLGAYVKVSAIDVNSGVEVSVVGAASAPQADLQRLARTKLLRQLQLKNT